MSPVLTALALVAVLAGEVVQAVLVAPEVLVVQVAPVALAPEPKTGIAPTSPRSASRADYFPRSMAAIHWIRSRWSVRVTPQPQPSDSEDRGARAIAAGATCSSASTLTVDDRGVALEVTAPADAGDVVYGLFGVPA